MIAEGVLAIEYGASSEDIARTTHAHVSPFSPTVLTANCSINDVFFLPPLLGREADAVRGVPRSRIASIGRQSDPLLVRESK